MAYQIRRASYKVLSQNQMKEWRKIPTAVASDCMNRTQSMVSAIKPVKSGLKLCGHVKTVTTMVGDCGIVCVAAAEAEPGQIIVVDAGGFEDVAIWGAIMTKAALVRGLGGAVIDGAVRDIAEIRKEGFPLYKRSVVPRGPHEGFGGIIDTTISAGGVSIKPGDIILGDDDGVVVVPLETAPEILSAAQDHLRKEQEWIRRIEQGENIPTIFTMPKAEPV